MTSESMIPAGSVGLLVVVVGWLLRRSIEQLDKSIQKFEGKLESLSSKDAQQDKEILRLDLRLGNLEGEAGRAHVWREDMTGFLQHLGFKKREGLPK